MFIYVTLKYVILFVKANNLIISLKKSQNSYINASVLIIRSAVQQIVKRILIKQCVQWWWFV